MTPSNPVAPRLHGGTDALGVPRHDFSTNANACGPCPAALAAVRQADPGPYPDAGYSDLRRQLAAFHGVDRARIVLAASASEFIFRITAVAAQAGQTRQAQPTVWLPPHSYGDYAQAARAHRLALASEPASAQLLWACEPSSPLGGAQPGLADMVDAQAHTACVVLDRAYEPLRLGGAPSLTAAQLDQVWQLWTPNKALALTGVRAAYAIAPLQGAFVAAALERLCPSWPVGAHGVALLQAWTRAEAQSWLAASLATLRDWKARQIALCESLGWTCLPSDANFFIARPALPEGVSLPQVLAGLRAQGIKLRDAASFGLPGQVRLSVQPPAAQDALHNAWQQLIKDMK
ncbi:MAG: aminotransferase class I/II-fold pyridoxal phosphate-dependent enzyme [Polaromonas sp.]